MNHSEESRTRLWSLAVVGVLFLSISTWIGLRAFYRVSFSEYQVRKLVEPDYTQHRPAGGRLFRAAYASAVPKDGSGSDLGRAQVLLLSLSDSPARRKLQSTIYLAAGDWRASAETLSGLSDDLPRDVEVLNNLGVAYLAMGETDPLYLFKSLDQFKKAAATAPGAAEPRFNLVILYRKLGLSRLAEAAEKEYLQLDPRSQWSVELRRRQPESDATALEELQSALDSSDVPRAQQIFADYAELFRGVVMRYGLAEEPPSQELMLFLGKEFKRRYRDGTPLAMLSPLFTAERERVIGIRQLVQRGAELYFQSRVQESLLAYMRAGELVRAEDPEILQYWIDINRVDTEIRAGDFKTAQVTLRRVIDGARRNDFRWLLGKALSIYGSNRRLSSSHAELIELLAEAERVYLSIGAPHDTVRPLYYLAFHTNGAGDHDESLRVALRCLNLTDRADAVRLSSLYWLIGSALYRKGLADLAVLFESESVEQARNSNNLVLYSGAASLLATLYESTSQPALAEKYLQDAEQTLEAIPAQLERIRAELSVNLVKGRMYLNRKRYTDAENVLGKNLAVHNQLPFPLTYVHAQSLMLRGRAYTAMGRIGEAREDFRQAIQVAEEDDQYLRAEKLRLAFDDERRELYDSAIAFEWDHHSREEAWGYLQKYRAKLFLEFLAQFDPNIERVRSRTLDRSSVQRLVGKDLQVIEYVLLEDRLLIWLTSDVEFHYRSVAVTRDVLEGKVQQILARLRNGDDITGLSEELGRLLIEPVGSLLDPNRTIAIIPDRALHGLPFGAIRPGGANYLIQQYTIVVSPSLTHLLATPGVRPNSSRIVSFGAQMDDTSGTRELMLLKDIYPEVTVHRGQQVDKPAFLAAMNTAPIFHYAGHSATDAVDPLRSSILLDGNRYGPNSVTAVDIAQQRLPDNALVVLSSCDSAVGNSRDGVGMRGLTSAFLIGGAGSVVGSLWPVEASSTSELMIRFHRAFATSKMPVAQALRKAQLAFLESFPERSHPYYWSGFVVTGNFSALR